MIEKRGEEYCVMTADGRQTIACHPTHDAAMEQLRAIEANKMHSLDGVEIFATGRHNGDDYTEADLDAMVEAFGQLDYQPPLKAGHEKDTPGLPALGYIANLRRAGNKLLADFVDVPSQVYHAIKGRRYNRVSAEIYWNLERGVKKFSRALKAVALLGAEIPAVAGLRPLQEHFEASGEIRAYDIEMNYAGQGNIDALVGSWNEWAGSFTACVAHLKGKPGISDPEAMCAWMEHEATGKWPAEKQHHQISGGSNMEPMEKLQATVAELSQKVADSETARADAIRKYEEQLAQANAQITSINATRRAEQIAQKTATLKIPALRPFVEAFYALANEQKVAFFADGKSSEMVADAVVDKLVETLNKHAGVLFKELSAGDNHDRVEHSEDPGAEVDKRTREYMAKNPVARYGEAMTAVLAANPELRRAYAAVA